MGHTHINTIETSTHAIIIWDKTKKELIQYLHGYCFRPTPRNFLKEIKMETSSLVQASTIDNCLNIYLPLLQPI